jgi:hypothetical protein
VIGISDFAGISSACSNSGVYLPLRSLHLERPSDRDATHEGSRAYFTSNSRKIPA